MNLSPFKDQLHFRLFALKAAATLDFLYLNLQPSSTDSSSLSLQWRSSFRLKGRCLQWPEMSAAVWSVYCHLLAQAPSKNPSGLRRRLWLRLGAEIHTRTHTSMQTDAQKTHTWGKTCSWRLWWRFSFFFFFFWNTPPGAHLLGSVCLFTSILVSAGVWHHGEKKLKYSSERIFYSGHKIYTCKTS